MRNLYIKSLSFHIKSQSTSIAFQGLKLIFNFLRVLLLSLNTETQSCEKKNLIEKKEENQKSTMNFF